MDRLTDQEVAALVAEAEERLGRKVCGARNRSGGVCQKAPMKGRNRCYYHGGKSATIGPAARGFRHGRYSKYLSTNLRERYEAALGDADMMNLEAEIALVESRLSDLLAEQSESPAILQWSQIGKKARAVQEALNEGNQGAAVSLSGELASMVSGAQAEAFRWNEIYQLVDTRRKLVESHAKKEKDLGTMISADRAYGMIQMIITLLSEKISDRNVLSEIVADIGSRIVGSPGKRPE